MSRRNFMVLACITVGSGLVLLWTQRDGENTGFVIREERRRMWGYLGTPANPISSWCAQKVKAWDTKRRIHGENSLDFAGAAMCWGYSNPTSAWFAFGHQKGGSNRAYFEFALPATQNVAAAVHELPTLEFRGVDSNYWAGRVGTNNIGFRSNTVGRGSIRLTVGSVLFVRHVEHPETVHLLHLDSMKEGWWHDVNVWFRRGEFSQQTADLP